MTHDRAYHAAGGAGRANESFNARVKADDALRSCVKAHGDVHADEYAARYDMTPAQIRSVHSITAEAMYMAVRFAVARAAACLGAGGSAIGLFSL